MEQRKMRLFPGLTLNDRDLEQIGTLRQRGALSERRWRRLRTLQMLHAGQKISDVARALGTYPREIRRVGWRYLEGGLDHALSEDERNKVQRLLDARAEAQVVAMACSDPPEGRARWTVVLLTAEAIRRKIVEDVSRETIRLVLARHDIKPWREKNVVRSRAGRAVRAAHGRHSRSA